MKISSNGLAVIKYFESCRLAAYRDSAGIPTIGWGHTGPDVRLGMTINQARADELLVKDLAEHERIVCAAVTVALSAGRAGVVLLQRGPREEGGKGWSRNAQEWQPINAAA